MDVPSSFYFLDDGSVISASAIPAGTIGYIAAQAQPVLGILRNGNHKCWLELGGERSMTIWDAEDDDTAALTIETWRLLIDPTSMIDARYASLSKGMAFRDGDRSGLVGSYSQGRSYGQYVAVGIDGQCSPLSTGEAKAFFSRWKIVTSTLGGNHVIAEHKGEESAH